MTDAPQNLARNIRQLRDARRLTQAQLAATAAIPRATLANLETGEANPTLAVLVAVASALDVSVEELLGAPRTTGRYYPVSELPVRRRGPVHIRKLLPDGHPTFDIERIEIPVGQRFSGVPHTPGTREYLTCERGTIELVASGERWVLTPGDVVVFRGDQPHSYRNAGEVDATAYSVVAVESRPG